jgi:hypothetical protein
VAVRLRWRLTSQAPSQPAADDGQFLSAQREHRAGTRQLDRQ